MASVLERAARAWLVDFGAWFSLLVEVSTRSDGRLEPAKFDQAETTAMACPPICFSRAAGAASRKVCIGVLP